MDRDVHVEQVGEAAGHRRRHAWYRIRRGGADAASFDIDKRTGQIRTRTGITYDYERDETFSLNVVATDGDNADSIAVTIAVKDVNEPPSLPPSNLSVQPGDQSLTAHFHWLVPLRGLGQYDLLRRHCPNFNPLHNLNPAAKPPLTAEPVRKERV